MSGPAQQCCNIIHTASESWRSDLRYILYVAVLNLPSKHFSNTKVTKLYNTSPSEKDIL